MGCGENPVASRLRNVPSTYCSTSRPGERGIKRLLEFVGMDSVDRPVCCFDEMLAGVGSGENMSTSLLAFLSKLRNVGNISDSS